jgi:hypothetical protein
MKVETYGDVDALHHNEAAGGDDLFYLSHGAFV